MSGTPRIAGRWLAGVVVALVLTSHRDAEACSCASTYSGHQACETRWISSAVFVGRVTSIESASVKIEAGGRQIDDPQRRVHFAVTEAFSGLTARETEVYTGTSEASCGFEFAIGGEYLVYAFQRPDGSLSTDICSPTKKLKDASGDLAYLRSVPAAPGRAGRVIGVVMHVEPSMYTRGVKPSPMAGVRIFAEGQGLIRSATTRIDGTYEIEMPPGRYALRAEPPAGMRASTALGLEPRTELKDARGCAVADFSVHFDGHITARVVTTSGAPVPFLPFTLRATDPTWPASSADGRTGPNGRIEIDQVPRGPFVIVTPPALGSVTSAVVQINPGARVDAGTIVVPDHLHFVTVTGVVLDPLGRPAEGARVYLEADSKELTLIGPAVVTGTDGRFSLSALEGERYRVLAERVPFRGSLTRDEIRITASRTMAGIILRPDIR
jgi:hypothetical protein